MTQQKQDLSFANSLLGKGLKSLDRFIASKIPAFPTSTPTPKPKPIQTSVKSIPYKGIVPGDLSSPLPGVSTVKLPPKLLTPTPMSLRKVPGDLVSPVAINKPKVLSLVKPTTIPTPTPPPDKAAIPYYEKINEAAKLHGVPQKILYGVLRKESMGFNPSVINGSINSPVGAQGIAQFMPETAKGIGLNPLNVNDAINAAAKYLKAKYIRHGSWKLALAAYNAGSGNVEKYSGVPPFKETLNYVKSILGE